MGGGHRAVGFIDLDRIVAALAEHLDQGGVGNRRPVAGDRHGAAIYENISGCVTACDDCVVDSVAEHTQQARASGKRCSGSHRDRPFKVMTNAVSRAITRLSFASFKYSAQACARLQPPEMTAPSYGRIS